MVQDKRGWVFIQRKEIKRERTSPMLKFFISKSGIVSLAVAAVLMASSGAQAGDAIKGKKLFNRCKSCHVVDKNINKTGPSLLGVIGRQAGSLEDYKKYSRAMRAAGAEGLVWDEENLATFIRKPKAFIKGTKMVFPGFRKDDQLADIIAYLKQFSE
jgi:cytochrome c